MINMKTKTVTINVTQEHIKRADMLDTYGCMIGLAMQDSLPLVRTSVGVRSGHFVHVCFPESPYNHMHDFRLPKRIERRILFMLAPIPRLFRNLFCRPFTFDLQVPDWAVAQEPVRNPIAVSSPEPYRDRIQGGHTPDGTHSSRAPLIASSVPLLALPLGI